MAILTCPKCLTKLKAPDSLRAGSRVTCSKCQQVFASVAAPATPANKSSDDIPNALFVDDEDERPRSRREVDDEDRPRARRRDRDVDNDDRPRARRRERDDDEDDRPRGRRRDRADDEPRRPTKRKRINPVLLAGGFVGLLVVLVGIIVLVAYFVKGGSASGTDLLVHAPSDAVAVTSFDVEALTKNEACKRAIERQPPLELAEIDRAGIRANDIAQVVVVLTPSNGRTCVIRFKSAPAQDKYLNAAITGKNYAPFKSLSGPYQYGYFADSYVLVLAEREATMQALVESKGKAKLSSDLQTRIRRTHGPMWRVSGPLTNDRNKVGPQEDGLFFRVGSSQGMAAWLVPDGELANVQIEVELGDELQAAQAAAMFRGMFQMLQQLNDFGRGFGPPNHAGPELMDIRKGYSEATVDVSNRRVTVKMKLPPGEAIRTVAAIRY